MFIFMQLLESFFFTSQIVYFLPHCLPLLFPGLNIIGVICSFLSAFVSQILPFYDPHLFLEDCQLNCYLQQRAYGIRPEI
ncbi:hypothetical protein RchiOBHm_Chr4g0425661 [Rosa chinensis]|uniref:Uncharacterized protein n=1 Tax=Rosa chinensis TaxID=74649 RepID=A0A2P6QZ62_ROSCH|nr:hypothetical protein RchiOBHm_Chr4g0425661 [Rosa chinensis]